MSELCEPRSVPEARAVPGPRAVPDLVAPPPTSLCARTVPLGPLATGPVDPVGLATAAADGFLLLGARGAVASTGVAAVLRLPGGLRPDSAPAVARWLAAVPVADELCRPASGVVAVGALPFAPGEAAALVVPRVTVVSTAAGERWATVVVPAADGAGGRPLDEAAAAGLLAATLAGGAVATGHAGDAGSSTDEGTVSGPLLDMRLWPDGPGFERAVERALRAIADGQLSKVVLARQVAARFAGPVDQEAVLRRLQRLEPACAVFAQRTGGRAFLGASPELLVRRRGATVVSHPLAGTAALRPSVEVAAARLASVKEQAEHAAAAAAVAGRLGTWCEDLTVPDRPSLVRLASVVHLGTRMVGRLRPAAGGHPPDALTLAAALHPTPAVAGVPTDAALAAISRLEAHGRASYAGPVGWVDARGDGELVVAIRSAAVDGSRAVAYAGAGIVAGSEPAAELAETTLKLRTALDALGLAADDDRPSIRSVG